MCTLYGLDGKSSERGMSRDCKTMKEIRGLQHNAEWKGIRYHPKLHGTYVYFVNLIRKANKRRKRPVRVQKQRQKQKNRGSTVEPSEDIVLCLEDSQGAVLLPVEELEVLTPAGVKHPTTTFWDSGSTVNLITFKHAKKMGLEGVKTQIQAQIAGHELETWKTATYEVPLMDLEGKEIRVLAYGMEQITGTLDPVSLEDAVHCSFANLDPALVARPSGAVDLLLGINVASLHPVPTKEFD